MGWTTNTLGFIDGPSSGFRVSDSARAQS